jgi:hypothetical protein
MTPEPQAKSLQQYIDESPVWHDQTPVGRAPLTKMQWRIWGLASAGKFFEGLVVFMTGVALPLLQLEFQLKPSESGLVGSATLFGILVGATALGGLAEQDRERVVSLPATSTRKTCYAEPNFAQSGHVCGRGRPEGNIQE